MCVSYYKLRLSLTSSRSASTTETPEQCEICSMLTINIPGSTLRTLF